MAFLLPEKLEIVKLKRWGGPTSLFLIGIIILAVNPSCGSTISNKRASLTQTCRREANVEVINEQLWEEYLDYLRNIYRKVGERGKFVRIRPFGDFRQKTIDAPSFASSISESVYPVQSELSKYGQVFARVKSFSLIIKMAGPVSMSCEVDVPEAFKIPLERQ